MAAQPDPIHLELHVVADAECDSEQLDRETGSLLREIADVGVESVTRIRSETAPAGTKAAGAITFGALALACLPVVLPKLVDFLKDWTMRGEHRKLKIKVKTKEGSVEVEFNPVTMSHEELRELLETVTGTLPGGS